MKTKVINEVRYTGFDGVEPIADLQNGPTCGFEAIENLVQLLIGNGNDLTERELIQRANHLGYVSEGDDGCRLNVKGYIPILNSFGINARWYRLDRGQILQAMEQNKGILIVGDAYYLRKEFYMNSNSWHSFILTNYYKDENGINFLGYTGIDSNFSTQMSIWPFMNVEMAANKAASKLSNLSPVLITDQSGNWPNTVRFYKMLRNGELVKVPY